MARSRATSHALRAIDGLDGRFAKVARVFSRDFGIDVVLSGFRCCTDGETIYLPMNADHLKDADARVLEGMLDHEWSHVKEEQEAKARQESWDRAGTEGPRPRTPLELMRAEEDPRVREMFNVYEDVRIERRSGARWPGVARNLAVLREHMVALHKGRGGGGEFWGALGCAIGFAAAGEDIEWAQRVIVECVRGMLADEVGAANLTRYPEECMTLARSTVAKADALHALLVEEQRRREEAVAAAAAAAKPEEMSDGMKETDEGGRADGDDDAEEEAGDRDDEAGGDDGAGGAAEGGRDEDDGSDGDADGDDSEGSGEGAPAAAADDAEPRHEGPDAPDSPGVGDHDGDGGGDADDDEEDDGGDGDLGSPAPDGGPDGGAAPNPEHGGRDALAEPSGDADGSVGAAEDDDGEDAEAAGEENGATDVSAVPEEDEGLTEEDARLIVVAVRRDGLTDDALEPLRELLERAATVEARTSKRYVPFPAAQRLDSWFEPEPLPPKVYAALRERVAPTTSALRSRVAALLRAKAQRRMEGDRERGSIDSGALYSVRLGERRVFAERSPSFDVNTAVSVLVDLSGSMGREARSKRLAVNLERVEFARMAVAALGETLSSVSVPFEVIGFDNDREAPGFDELPRSRQDLYSRYMGFRYWQVKLFRESWSRARNKVPAIHAGSENVDGEALVFATRRLLERAEERRVLLVFSDGIPQGGCDDDKNQENLRDAIKRIASAGVEVIGVGVQSPSVEYFYKGVGVEGFNLADLDDLAPAVLRALKKRMVDEGMR